jgi:AraC-like DNA-binding protein
MPAVSPEFGLRPERPGTSPVPGWDLLAARAPQRARSVAEARDYLGRLLVPHRLSLHGHARVLQLHHTVARIGRLGLHFIDYRSHADSVEVHAPRLGNNYFLQFPLCGVAEVSQGGPSSVHIRPGMMFVGQPNKPQIAAMSRDYRQLMLEVPEELLLAARRCQAFAGPLLFDVDAIHAAPAPRLLLGTLDAICAAIEAGDGSIALPAVQRAFQETLTTLVLTLPHNMARPSSDDAGGGPVPYYVRRAEAYMRAHLTENVGIDDLVRAAGISRRSLHAGFRRFRGTTPLGLFKALRLEAARNALLRTRGAPVTVTDVATTYGFYHLSKFARDFRETFGELPSELLRKAGQ